MALRIIILFSLSEILLGHVARPNFEKFEFTTVDECCQDGRHRGNKGHDCTIIPLFSSSHICRIAQEQCCSAAREMHLCYNGVIMAQGQGACEVPFFEGEPWEAKISKTCCDCCTLGLMTAHDAPGCSFNQLLLNGQCSDTAKTCCVNKTMEDAKTKPAQPMVNVTANPPFDCTDLPCSHFCIDNSTCGCFKGFQLQNDGVNCEDINECLAGTHNCFNNLVCINKEGSFLCQRITSCGSGYELNFENTCQDLDECILGIHNCGADQICINTPGSFQCNPAETCPAGFTKDAAGSCTDVNECVAHSSPCLPGEICINTEGSFICHKNTVTCGRGYHLSQDGTRCEDVDECQTGNVCGEHNCFNQVGTYRCECRKGFFFNGGTKLCEDLNECRYYQGLCAHNCENTVGSYRCYCHPGYQLSDSDGMTCEDIDECALPSGGHACSYSCTNVPGTYYCTCPPTGYILAPNGQTCLDIDECAAGIHTCSASESCFNIQGGFRCLSFSCPANFHKIARGSTDDPLVALRCMKHCHPNDLACNLVPVHFITYICLSLPTFRDFIQPEDVIYLQTSMPFKASPQPHKTDIFFKILSTDVQASFEAQKRAHRGMIIGVIQQVKPIIGPMDLVLQVVINYIQSGVISHCNIVFVHVFISDRSS